jgi:hypothetical protein
VNLGNAAAFLLVAVLAGAVLWRRGHYPFCVRVGLVLLALLGMVLIPLSGMGEL